MTLTVTDSLAIRLALTVTAAEAVVHDSSSDHVEKLRRCLDDPQVVAFLDTMQSTLNTLRAML